MKTIEQAITAASRCLANVGVENARAESEFLVAACLGVPRLRLVLDRKQLLSPPQVRTLRVWLREREKRKPLAYVAKEQPFRDLNLKVSPSVLVPRPETELVVEQALRVMDQFPRPLTVIDVGTGSGNIALSLAMHSQAAFVIGVDCSKRALKVAQANAASLLRRAPVRWLHGDLLTPLNETRPEAGLIVANLPYIRTAELRELDPELHWEPRIALDGGRDGLRLIARCVKQAPSMLRDGGVLLLEIGAAQSKAVTELFADDTVWEDVRMFRDFTGLPRIMQAHRTGK